MATAIPAIPSTTAAAASAIASTTTASTVPAASATAALGLRARFVDVDGAAADLRTVQGRDGLISIFVAGHFDETESARAPRVAVGHDADPINLSVRFKSLTKLIFTGVEAQIPHKNILHAYSSALSCRECKLIAADLAGKGEHS
jgi:hypothetical protein